MENDDVHTKIISQMMFTRFVASGEYFNDLGNYVMIHFYSVVIQF